MNMLHDLLTVQEASTLTGWTVATIYTKLSRREIAKVKLGPRTVRIRRADLMALMRYLPALPSLCSPVSEGGAR